MHHEVVVLRRSKVSRSAQLPPTVETSLLGNGKTRGRLQSAAALRQLAKERQFDLIHASLPEAALIGRLVGMTSNTPVVESLVNISHEPIRTVDNPHVTLSKLQKHVWLDRATMSRIRRFHAVSNAVAESWTKMVRIDPQKIDVIPRGIDRSFFSVDIDEPESRQSVRDEFGLDPDSFVIISVGRQEPQKGHRYLLEATRMLVEGHPETHVLIVGRESLSTHQLTDQVESLGLDNAVTLTGVRHDLPRLLSAADVFAFPSLFEGNGGNAMIEAMTMGLPIVTTAAAPMTDLVPDERYGLLVPRMNSEMLAAAIERLFDPDLRRTLGAAARGRAQEFATPDELARVYESWYQSVLGLDE